MHHLQAIQRTTHLAAEGNANPALVPPREAQWIKNRTTGCVEGYIYDVRRGQSIETTEYVDQLHADIRRRYEGALELAGQPTASDLGAENIAQVDAQVDPAWTDAQKAAFYRGRLTEQLGINSWNKVGLVAFGVGGLVGGFLLGGGLSAVKALVK